MLCLRVRLENPAVIVLEQQGGSLFFLLELPDVDLSSFSLRIINPERSLNCFLLLSLSVDVKDRLSGFRS